MMIFLTFFLPIVSAYYSIHYSAKENHPSVIGQATFSRSPSATQVADIYLRVSGQNPILNEVQSSLPSIDILQKSNSKPVILHLIGGEIPSAVSKSIVTVEKNEKGPSLNEIQTVLRNHKIQAETKEMVNANSVEILDWISKQEQPVFILHQDFTPLHSRKLQTQSNITDAPLSEEEISSYQITLWTGVVFFLLLLSGVCAIVGMDVIPDSLLFAKFQSSRTNKSD